MKAIILFCAIALALANDDASTYCLPDYDEGPCRGYFPMFYYDYKTRTCKEFIYGGCDGNANRHESEEACMKKCGDVVVIESEPQDVCERGAEPGMCDAYFPRFYFDKNTGKCEKFVYGGCGDNGNNFKTVEECEKRCGKTDDLEKCLAEPETGLCRGYFPMYYYDPKTRSCETFIYGGCGGNANKHETEKACMDTCRDVVVFESESQDVCELGAETGMCAAYFPRFYFNKDTGKCEKFIYGGCGSNGNNFETVDECERRCGKTVSHTTACQQEKVVGPCKVRALRYFYNKQTGQCEQFIYGGCHGNSNNFESKEDCEDACTFRYSAVASKGEACTQEKIIGSCKGAFPRYYYNKQTGQCELFIYGGCDGNSNNFNEKSDCEKVCVYPNA